MTITYEGNGRYVNGKHWPFKWLCIGCLGTKFRNFRFGIVRKVARWGMRNCVQPCNCASCQKLNKYLEFMNSKIQRDRDFWRDEKAKIGR